MSAILPVSRSTLPDLRADIPLSLDFVQSASKRRDELGTEVCECMIDIGAALFSVSSKELRKPGRTSESVSRVRQIIMYVTHVVLRLNMGEIGRGFARDRTTVQYACRVVEDLRDDPHFDRVVSVLESVAFAAFRNRLGL